MSAIKVVKNFISEEDCQELVNFIENNHETWVQFVSRSVKIYGKNSRIEHHESTDWSEIAPINDTLRRALRKIRDYAIETYSDEDLEICTIWISKQKPGGFLQYHHDNDEGRNPHFKYSAVLYLNTISTGRLEFPFRRFSYKPNAGDFVMFESQPKDNGHKIDRIDDNRYSVAIWLAAKEYSMWDYLQIEPNV